MDRKFLPMTRRTNFKFVPKGLHGFWLKRVRHPDRVHDSELRVSLRAMTDVTEKKLKAGTGQAQKPQHSSPI